MKCVVISSGKFQCACIFRKKNIPQIARPSISIHIGIQFPGHGVIFAPSTTTRIIPQIKEKRRKKNMEQ
jgi:hypothetical protein